MTEKTPPTVRRFEQLAFQPRFAYGEMAEVSETCGTADGTELGCGWGRFSDARIPWTVKYDEMLTVFEGELTLHANGTPHVLGPKDSIWIPAGTELVYEARNALVHYAIHPANWNENND